MALQLNDGWRWWVGMLQARRVELGESILNDELSDDELYNKRAAYKELVEIIKLPEREWKKASSIIAGGNPDDPGDY